MNDRRTRNRWRHRAVATVCVVLLAGCGPAAGTVVDDDPVPPRAAPSDAPVSSADTTTDAAAGAETSAARLGMARSVADTGDLVIAVGADDGGPAAWSLDADGAWDPRPVEPAADVRQLDAAAHDGAVGVAFGGDDAGGSHAWVTDDSGGWRRHDVTGIDGRVSAVAVGDGRWIVVGDRVDPEGGEAYEGAVWVSEDGESFDVLAEGLPLTEGTLSDVATADGVVVVTGFDVDGGAVWTSSDGDAFASGTGPFDAATIDGVAATDGAFVALGRGLADLELRAWTSADGRRWESVDVTSHDLRPEDELHDLATVAGVVTAVGDSAGSGALWAFEEGALVPFVP